jgi:hypothetical protein
MKNIVLFAFVLILSSCIQEDIDFSRKGDGTQINIYLVKDGQIDHSKTDIDLNLLELEKNPWLKHAEIEFYDWSSNIFYLNVEKEKEKYSGQYFVLKADENPLLLGVFFSMFMSSIPQFPSIIAHDDFFLPKDVIGFGGSGFYESSTSLKNKSDFRIALEKSGLLKEGIEVELTRLTKVNSSSLKYTFKVTNLDTESIYILDPNKMGDSRFHYYTNGVNLRFDGNYYWPNDFDVIASENIRPSWYYKLYPGKSMERTVSQNGYISLPTGEVIANFNFPGVNLKEKGEWKKSDGRIWMGNFRTEKELTLK